VVGQHIKLFYNFAVYWLIDQIRNNIDKFID
jgi:hypothetical protein